MVTSITDIENVENLLKIGEYNKMWRINYKGLRLYVSENPFKYYSGLTGALSAATFKGSPETRRLKGWRESMIDSFGKKAANDYLQMTAEFGTLLHMALVTIKENGKIDWKEEEEKAFGYFIEAYRKQELDPNVKVIRDMVYEYQKHVASLMQFIYERVHEIYAIETPATWEDLCIATPIDLFCSCRQTPKGDFKKTTVNLKTSSQISKHQLEQVSCEFMMWNETYGDAEYTGIMRTKNWTESKIPSYEYKGIVGNEAFDISNEAKNRLRLCLNSDASYYPNPKSKTFSGITEIGKQPEIIVKSLAEEWETIDRVEERMN